MTIIPGCKAATIWGQQLEEPLVKYGMHGFSGAGQLITYDNTDNM